MFEVLSQSSERGPLGGGVASFTVHAALITAAVLATVQAKVAGVAEHVVVPLVYVERPQASPPRPAPSLIGGTPPVPGEAPRLVIPTLVPGAIPPPSSAPFDPGAFTAAPAPMRPAPSAGPGAPEGGVIGERWVEQRPELIGHPAVVYPELLRRAGIEGRVVVEAVIDTTGRVEPRTIHVMTATNPLFAPAARAMVAGSRYRPGAVGGRPVRVRVLVPVDFRVEAGAARM
jgi:periplasmic protein TonB